MDNITNDFADVRNRIFKALSESGMSQKEFALRIQVSPQTITDWKKGKSFSFIKILGAIAIALKTSPAWLVFGTGGKDMPKEEQLHLLKSQISSDVSEIRDAMEQLRACAPGLANLSLIAMAIASAYDEADPGTQAAVRKLLDVNILSKEPKNDEAM